MLKYSYIRLPESEDTLDQLFVTLLGEPVNTLLGELVLRRARWPVCYKPGLDNQSSEWL